MYKFCMLALLLAGCNAHTNRKVIVLGVDGMDPGFVERHWADLPNLHRFKHFSRLATTTPPQSPVAWSTFITGLDPGDHGIFDFVHRDPSTHNLFLSTDRTIEPRFRLSLGPYELPLTAARVQSLRQGTAFWQILAGQGVPVTIVRIPANYPPLAFGEELSGMGTPDLRGTQSTFSFYTDEALETSRAVAGGLIRKVGVAGNHVDLVIEGPPNSLRKDHAYTLTHLAVDIDPEQDVARLQAGAEVRVIKQGEWSDWIPIEFPLIPHLVSTRGMVRVFAMQLHPGFRLYVSPVNIDPMSPALPVSSPPEFARSLGRFYTLGIPEDTAALRQGVFDLPQFLTQSRLVLKDEQTMLNETLSRFRGGFLFFYFSSIDQNSHILWRKHDEQLLNFYRAVDKSIGEVIEREPEATLIVMSDHGFTEFDRAVNLNTWLLQQGWPQTAAYASGLNALYAPGVDRSEIRRRLLALRDPANGRKVIETLEDVHPSPANRAIAPDMIVGYAPGYRASWETGVGETGAEVLEDNTDPWIGDHCINARDVPGVLFSNRDLHLNNPSLRTLSAAIRELCLRELR